MSGPLPATSATFRRLLTAAPFTSSCSRYLSCDALNGLDQIVAQRSLTVRIRLREPERHHLASVLRDRRLARQGGCERGGGDGGNDLTSGHMAWWRPLLPNDDGCVGTC